MSVFNMGLLWKGDWFLNIEISLLAASYYFLNVVKGLSEAI